MSKDMEALPIGLGSRFVVKTDKVATSYFQTQKKVSPKKARWQD